MSVVDPIAQGIADVCEGLDVTASVKSFKWAPRSGEIEKPPAAVVYVPTFRRTEVGPDVPEDHLGFRNWYLDFPVHFYFAADDVEYAAAQIVETIEAFIQAIDASMDPAQPLNGDCDDIKVAEVDEPIDATVENNRPIWEVRSRVQVVVFVP